MAELVAEEPAAEEPAMLDGGLTADKVLTTLAAFLPFVGPWLIHRSEAHKPGEKRALSWISIGLTAFGILALLSRLPSPRDQYARLRQGVVTQIRWLAGLGEHYRLGTLDRDVARRGAGDSPAPFTPSDAGSSKE